MFKKSVRIGIIAILALFMLFGTVGAGYVHAAKSAIATDYTFVVLYVDWVWNGNLNTDTWPQNPTEIEVTWPSGTTIGQVRADLTAQLGYPVILFTATDGNCGSNFPFYHQPSDSDKVDIYYCGNGFAFAALKERPKSVEIPRLTLYGYVSDSNQSCVLWSLNGVLPVNVDKTCGSQVKLVCTVQLFGKELKYDCKDGYDWLGEQIIHDPKWLSWADRFASMNGHR